MSHLPNHLNLAALYEDALARQEIRDSNEARSDARRDVRGPHGVRHDAHERLRDVRGVPPDIRQDIRGYPDDRWAARVSPPGSHQEF